MIQINNLGIGLLDHKQAEPFNMLHIHGTSFGCDLNLIERNSEIIPPWFKHKLLIIAITELIFVLLMMHIMNAAIEQKLCVFRIIYAKMQSMKAAPVMRKVKQRDA